MLSFFIYCDIIFLRWIMKAKSYAKINLSLDVLSRREDGYHNIETIMQKVELHDVLDFQKADSGFELYADDESLSCGEDNLIYKAWKALCEYTGRELPVRINLTKNIPIAAGLAGGTGNGAVTLKALNKMYNLNLSSEELMKMSVKLGADFPYMIMGGTAIAEGIGEELKKTYDFSGVKVLIVNPGYGISTKEVYESLKLGEKKIKTDEIANMLKYKDVSKLKNLLYNKMEESVFQNHEDIREIKEKLRGFNSVSLMSGSGATVFGLFRSEEDLERAYEYFRGIYEKTYKTYTVGGSDEF